MDHSYRIAAGRILLRPLAVDDLDLTREWRNRDENRKWFVHSDLIAPDQHRLWFENYRSKPGDLMFIISLAQESARPVGTVALYGIDVAAGCAEFGRLLIGEAAARGKGIGLLATVALRDFAVETLGLSWLFLEVLADNAPAIGIYEKAGFVREPTAGGLLRMVWRR